MYLILLMKLILPVVLKAEKAKDQSAADLLLCWELAGSEHTHETFPMSSLDRKWPEYV